MTQLLRVRACVLQVYDGTCHMIERNFAKAAELFLDGVATFTCFEMFDYGSFVAYTVLTSLLSLERPVLKSKARRRLGCLRVAAHLCVCVCVCVCA